MSLHRIAYKQVPASEIAGSPATALIHFYEEGHIRNSNYIPGSVYASQPIPPLILHPPHWECGLSYLVISHKSEETNPKARLHPGRREENYNCAGS